MLNSPAQLQNIDQRGIKCGQKNEHSFVSYYSISCASTPNRYVRTKLPRLNSTTKTSRTALTSRSPTWKKRSWFGLVNPAHRQWLTSIKHCFESRKVVTESAAAAENLLM